MDEAELMRVMQRAEQLTDESDGPPGFEPAPLEFGPTSVDAVAVIGRRLFTDYAFQFEVTSILILVAMLGAVLMARREDRASTGKR